VKSSILVLVNPFLDVGHLNVASLSHAGWILWVWWSEVQVMCTALNVESDTRAISRNVLVEATSSPRVQLAIAPHDVGYCEEIFVDIVASEVVQSPIVVRSQAICVLAKLSVCLIVDSQRNEHGILTQASRHEELVASKDVPTESIE